MSTPPRVGRRGVPLTETQRARMIAQARDGKLVGRAEVGEASRIEALASLARSRGVPVEEVLAAVERDEEAVRRYVAMPSRRQVNRPDPDTAA